MVTKAGIYPRSFANVRFSSNIEFFARSTERHSKTIVKCNWRSGGTISPLASPRRSSGGGTGGKYLEIFLHLYIWRAIT